MLDELFSIHLCSEDTILLTAISADKQVCHRQVIALTKTLMSDTQRPSQVTDIVPAYDSLLIQFNGLAAKPEQIEHWLISVHVTFDQGVADSSVTLPVCYSLDRDNDIQRLMEHAGLSRQALIEKHVRQTYQVMAIGFSPGFAYLGGCDQAIRTPRLSKPRTHVDAGAVAIADDQTAIYPSASPGGWNIIGYCPLTMIDFEHEPFTPFEIGQAVQFNPINQDEFQSLVGTYWHQYHVNHQ